MSTQTATRTTAKAPAKAPAKKATVKKTVPAPAPAPTVETTKVNRNESDPRVLAVRDHFKTDASADEIYEVVKKALSLEGAIKKFDLHLNPALATARFDADPRVVAVQAHAKENYETGGWDVVVETMSNEDIYEVVKRALTPEGAIKKMAAHVGVVDEVRAEHIAESKA